MTRFARLLPLCALVALAACSDPFGGSGTGQNAAPGSTADPSSVAYFQQTVGDRVLFPVDQAVLTDGARATVNQQAKWLTANGAYTAVVEGHADEQGTREYNLALGARRATAVRDQLVEAGVAPGRIRTLTYGKERPLEVCSEEACYEKNRRAVTVLTAGGTS
ncbi:peptidoglycan-associated lipoprotein Pal [Fluviibacterium sp. S390]|uniref:peptidoglycan-associated lipoprotein Pal n=1 Tax=Fluviibacterium sp. S390 TaxID=3415139 RepID=UPI003C7D328F